jgi:hypothetical protein
MIDNPPAGIEQAPRLAARLAHDVGKYVARTAHNVAPSAWTPALSRMLCRDLFELAAGRASMVFEALANPIEALAGAQPELDQARRLLAEIDRLEPAVRVGEVSALVRAAVLALAVEEALRDLLRNLQEHSS